MGADLDIVDLSYDQGWKLDLDEVAEKVKPGTTRLISITCPHNPTGTMLQLDDLKRLVGLAERAEAVLLVDETCRDLTHRGDRIPLAATLLPQRGERELDEQGVRASRDPHRVGGHHRSAAGRTLLAAKEQIVICGSTIDEHIAGRVLADRKRVLTPIMADARERLAIVDGWMAAQDTFEWIRPSGDVVGLVRFRASVEVDEVVFHHRLLADHGTYVGPGPTGSRSATGTSGSASGGPPTTNCVPGSMPSSPPRATLLAEPPVEDHMDPFAPGDGDERHQGRMRLRGRVPQGRQMGFDGKTLIHPSQLEPANRIWAPTPEAVEDAAALIARFEAAVAEGKGAVTHNGRMIENLHVDNTRHIVAVAVAVAVATRQA